MTCRHMSCGQQEMRLDRKGRSRTANGRAVLVRGKASEPTAQAARRIGGTLKGREPGPPTCEKGCVRQSSP